MRKISCIELLSDTETVDPDRLVCVHSWTQSSLPYHRQEVPLTPQVISMPVKSFILYTNLLILCLLATINGSLDSSSLAFQPQGSLDPAPSLLLIICINLAIPGFHLTSKPTVTPSLNTENSVCSSQPPQQPSGLCKPLFSLCVWIVLKHVVLHIKRLDWFSLAWKMNLGILNLTSKAIQNLASSWFPLSIPDSNPGIQ